MNECRRIDPSTGKVTVVERSKKRPKSKKRKPPPKGPQGTLADAAERIVAENERRSPLLKTIR